MFFEVLLRHANLVVVSALNRANNVLGSQSDLHSFVEPLANYAIKDS